MAIRFASTAWLAALETQYDIEDRVYVDFRQKDFAAVTATDVTWSAVTSGDNQPGDFNLIVNDATTVVRWLYALPDTLTIRLRFHAQFAYDTEDDHTLLHWGIDGTHYLDIEYDASSDMLAVRWYDGGNLRSLYSERFDDGSSYHDIDAWYTLDLVLDLTTESTAGSAMYLNRALQTDEWSGAIDAKTSGFAQMTLGCKYNGLNPADTYFNSLLIIPGYLASATEVAADYKGVEVEQIMWSLDGHLVGRTRCDVTRFVRSLSMDRAVEDMNTGSLVGNRAYVDLKSPAGQFADDQYAAWDPANNVYNGTSAQRYMRRYPRVMVETWYANAWEPMFFGRIESGFARATAFDRKSTARLTAIDLSRDMALRELKKGRFWEDKKLSDATEADSLVHLIARLATQKEHYNYLANASFENATIGNSWYTADDGLTREAGGLLGSYHGQLANDSGGEVEVSQTVTFTGTKKLNVGESWTFALYLRAGDAQVNDVRLEEHDAAGINGTASTTEYTTGTSGWTKWEVTRTIADATSDRLKVIAEVADGATVVFDCAMLTQTERALDWFVPNDNEGAAGVESADDADSASYDACGFDVAAVNIVHPWARVEQGQSVWDNIKQLADATGAYKAGFNEASVFELGAVLATGFSDPTPLRTITGARAVTAEIPMQQANHIIMRGVNIIKDDYGRIVWNAGGSFPFAKPGTLAAIVADDGYWPDPTTYGRFIARYGDIGEGPSNPKAGG